MKKLFLLFLIFTTSTMFAQIERIEPPFWYAGMKNPELQIMFYGKNIAKYNVSTTNSIPITKVERTSNQNYIFVTINTKNTPPKEFHFLFKEKDKVVFTEKYNLKQRRENSAERKSFDASDMMYLIMPDRFSNGNSNNNSDASTTEKYNRELPEGRHGGDIQGIINHLDYIKELGATTLWITPLCEDNEAVYSYHTYAQTDVYKIDPRYGTNEDYARLASEMHKKNLKLVMDYVTNHWGMQHWMMKDLPTQDWIHQFENFTQTNHRRTVIHDINASKSDTKICMDGWFAPSMPDLNQTNPLVLNYLTQNAIWWIEFANLDGFRVDTYNYADPTAITKWTKAITDEYPNFNIVGEISMRDQAQLSYWQKDSPIGKIQNFNSHLPSVMDFNLSDELLQVFNVDEGKWGLGMDKIYDNFTNDFLFPNPNNLLIFAENHDTHRVNHIYQNDIRKYKMAMALIATARGIPQTYYGSEVGMAGNKDLGDAAIRQDFPGGWEGDANNAFTKEGRTDIQNDYFNFTSKLFNWRKNKSVIHFGKMTHYIPENNTYIYFRHNATEIVMVAFNNSNETKTLKTERFAENIGNFKTGKDIITDQLIDITQEVRLEPKSVLILELK
ncbi:MAG TPA: glycoside hydrolase family 13 protein [Flavobacterium alvei]|nr:glycoside hydrolase family 13 protein [Flavobacterium alvei]